MHISTVRVAAAVRMLATTSPTDTPHIAFIEHPTRTQLDAVKNTINGSRKPRLIPLCAFNLHSFTRVVYCVIREAVRRRMVV